MNHGSVSTWMRKFREYTRTNYKSDISEIFGTEEIPGSIRSLNPQRTSQQTLDLWNPQDGNEH